jgi:hypothetical protein
MTTLKNNLFSNKYWGSLIPVLVCLFLSPPTNFTENFTVVSTAKDFHYYDIIIDQMKEIKHLPFPEETHESKMEVRILVPLVLKFLYPLNTQHLPIFIYIINLIALYAFSIQLCIFQTRSLPIIQPIFLTSLLFGTVYTGISFTMDFWPMFDGIAFLLLLTSLNQDNKYLSPVIILLSLFIDERSIFPGAMILIYQNKNQLSKSVIQIFAIVLTYFGLRTLLHEFYGLNSVFVKSHDLVLWGYINKDNFGLFLIATINCFKHLWIFPLSALLIFHKSTTSTLGWDHILKIIGIGFCFVGSFLAATAVADFTRSFSYGFPLFLISLKYIYNEFYINKKDKIGISLSHLILVIIFCNLITETHFFHSGESLFNTVDILSKIGANLLK